MNNLELLEKKLKYNFKDKSLLLTALTHKSYVNENAHKNLYHNERLEFLGDAVLDLITTEYLYFKYPNYDEGILTKIQSQVISEKMLSQLSKEIGIGDFLRLSRGEIMLGGRRKNSIMGDSFETIIAAIYLDSNIDEAKKVALRYLAPLMDNFKNIENLKDYKTELQEEVQLKYGKLPKYIYENAYGPDHNKIFQMSVYINGEKLGLGFASNKKEAEKLAAKQALEKIREE